VWLHPATPLVAEQRSGGATVDGLIDGLLGARVVMGTAEEWEEARRWTGAFLAGHASSQTRRSYRRDLDCWFTFCAAHHLHPFRALRRTHLEVYLRELDAQPSPPSAGTLYRRISRVLIARCEHRAVRFDERMVLRIEPLPFAHERE
jgi:hypothetical protein